MRDHLRMVAKFGGGAIGFASPDYGRFVQASDRAKVAAPAAQPGNDFIGLSFTNLNEIQEFGMHDQTDLVEL